MRGAHPRRFGITLGGPAVIVTATLALLLGAPAPVAAGGTVPGTVSVTKGRLVVRAAASSTAAQVGALPNKAKVTIVCQVTGEPIKGKVRKTSKWDRLTNGQYVSDAFITRNTRVAVPACPPPVVVPAPAPVQPVAGPGLRPELDRPQWTTPVPRTNIGGFRTPARPEHDGVDLVHPRETPIVSVTAGTVVTVRCNASTPTCDVDGSPGTTGCGWYVEVRHAAANDVVTRYCHLVRQPVVRVGDPVTTGQLLGYVGTSGHSSGPHLHFEVHLGYPASRANAVDPVAFMRQAGAPL